MTHQDDFTLPAVLLAPVLSPEPSQHAAKRQRVTRGCKRNTVWSRAGEISTSIPPVREGGMHTY